MSRARRAFEFFDLAFGRLLAVILGGAGLLVLSIAFGARDFQDALLPLGIGSGLLLVSAALLYWRVTFVRLLEFFAGFGSSN